MTLLLKLQAGLAVTLYLLLTTLLLPCLPLRLWWRSRRAPAYRERMAERFGLSSITPRANGIWVHAVSVGETFAATPTVKTLQQRYPDLPITVTTTTPTGSEQVTKIFGSSVEHVYAPYDWPLCIWLFVRRVRPAVLVVMETEVWPVTILLCRCLGIPVLIANARLSSKSASGYQKIRWLLQVTLQRVWVAAQHQSDAERFIALGAAPACVEVTGSVKFDVQLGPELRAEAEVVRDHYRAQGKPFIWIAASTHDGEEIAAMQAHKQLLAQQPQALLIVVPRHPERFNSVAKLAESLGLECARRSQHSQAGSCVLASTQVLLVDTLGDLLMFYGVADSAFVGGSLCAVGGHNYLEPAIWARPILSGPHTHNFANIAEQLQAVGALTVVHSSDELASALLNALKNPAQLKKSGDAGLALLEVNRGASEKLLDFISQRLD